MDKWDSGWPSTGNQSVVQHKFVQRAVSSTTSWIKLLNLQDVQVCFALTHRQSWSKCTRELCIWAQLTVYPVCSMVLFVMQPWDVYWGSKHLELWPFSCKAMTLQKRDWSAALFVLEQHQLWCQQIRSIHSSGTGSCQIQREVSWVIYF